MCGTTHGPRKCHKFARYLKNSMSRKSFKSGLPYLLVLISTISFSQPGRAQSKRPAAKRSISSNLYSGFHTPPDAAKSRVYWFWIYNRVTKEGIQRDLQEFKAKGISGV